MKQREIFMASLLPASLLPASLPLAAEIPQDARMKHREIFMASLLPAPLPPAQRERAMAASLLPASLPLAEDLEMTQDDRIQSQKAETLHQVFGPRRMRCKDSNEIPA